MTDSYIRITNTLSRKLYVTPQTSEFIVFITQLLLISESTKDLGMQSICSLYGLHTPDI